MNASAHFFESAIEALAVPHGDRAEIKVLDFGCGEGQLVRALSGLGFSASGCDVDARWPSGAAGFSVIAQQPYRLPYPDGSYDCIVSTSVLEHVQNKEQVFREMHRIMRPGGIGLHLYPSKWYLPYEPHVYVPLMNWFWPRCPRWWLALWALLGVKNRFQTGESWGSVVAHNSEYARTGVSYWSNRRIAREARAIFGDCEFPVQLYMRHGGGGAAPVLRFILGEYLGGWVNNTFRMSFLAFRKSE